MISATSLENSTSFKILHVIIDAFMNLKLLSVELKYMCALTHMKGQKWTWTRESSLNKENIVYQKPQTIKSIDTKVYYYLIIQITHVKNWQNYFNK